MNTCVSSGNYKRILYSATQYFPSMAVVAQQIGPSLVRTPILSHKLILGTIFVSRSYNIRQNIAKNYECCPESLFIVTWQQLPWIYVLNRCKTLIFIKLNIFSPGLSHLWHSARARHDAPVKRMDCKYPYLYICTFPYLHIFIFPNISQYGRQQKAYFFYIYAFFHTCKFAFLPYFYICFFSKFVYLLFSIVVYLHSGIFSRLSRMYRSWCTSFTLSQAS